MSGSAAQSTTSFLWSVVFRECPPGAWHKWSKGHDSERITRPDFCGAPLCFVLRVPDSFVPLLLWKIVFHTPGPPPRFLLLSSSERLNLPLLAKLQHVGLLLTLVGGNGRNSRSLLGCLSLYVFTISLCQGIWTTVQYIAFSSDVLGTLSMQTRDSNLTVIFYVSLSHPTSNPSVLLPLTSKQVPSLAISSCLQGFTLLSFAWITRITLLSLLLAHTVARMNLKYIYII